MCRIRVLKGLLIKQVKLTKINMINIGNYLSVYSEFDVNRLHCDTHKVNNIYELIKMI